MPNKTHPTVGWALLLLLMASCGRQPENAVPVLGNVEYPAVTRTESEYFAKVFHAWMVTHDKRISPEEIEIVIKIHPYLLAALGSDDPFRLVQFLRPIPEEREISWDEAVKLIRDGKIIATMQSHNHDVSLSGRNGVVYNTTEPRIDEVLREVQKVDPTMKFITYGTE